MMIEITPEYLASQHLSEDFPQRFWSKVNKTDSCWLWTAGRFGRGYGSIARGSPFRGYIQAHRGSWMINQGPIPDGLQVLHNCPGGDNVICVNFNHLWLGTTKDNLQDASHKGKFDNRKGEQNAHSKLTEAQVLEIRDRYVREKCPCCVLAKEFGVNTSAIDNIISGEGWTHLTGGVSVSRPPGGETGNHTLTIADVLEIRRLHATGTITMTRLAEQFNVHIPAISRIIHRLRWPNV